MYLIFTKYSKLKCYWFYFLTNYSYIFTLNMIQPYFKNIKKQIITELSKAQSEINVAVCWFTNKELFEILCKKLSAKVSVNLIVQNDSINNRNDGLDFQKFVDLGGKFYFSDTEAPMHNKYCIIDNKLLINGSYNWTYFAENKNKENIMIINDEVMAGNFLVDFKRLVHNLKRVKNVAAIANFDSQSLTIVENTRLASDTDLIINSKSVISKLKLTITETLGVITLDDKFCVFIPKNSSIPNSKTFTLSTVFDNQTQIHVVIRYGDNLKGSLNNQLGDFTIVDLPPMEKGKAGIITRFLINDLGILTVTATITGTKKTTEKIINVLHLLNRYK